MTRQPVRLLPVVAVIGLLSGAARAEREYEYGMALYKTFGFEDLAEKLFTDLKEKGSANERLSGVLGLGGIKQEQAKAAEKKGRPAEAQRLFEEARRLYDQFLDQAPPNHPERSTALATITEIKKKEALSKVKEASTETDKDRKEQLQREAREILEELVKPLEQEAKRARKAFDKHVDEKGEFDKLKRDDRADRTRLMKGAVESMQRLYNMQLELASVYEEGSKERKKFLDEMIQSVVTSSEYWESEGYMGVVFQLNLVVGRAYALNGEPTNAYEKGFDYLIVDNPQKYPAGGPREFVDEVRLLAFYLKTKTAFDSGDYEMAIKTVDQLFMPAIGAGGGYPDALSDDRGNGARLMRANAYIKMEEPSYARAVQDCQKVIAADHGGWPNNARHLLARIVATMPEGAAVTVGPEILHSAAFGQLQLAIQEADPKKRRDSFERAVGFYERAIIACRDKDTAYRLRLRHEPQAWFELGVCYSRLRLWYEAGFAFEAVLRFFAKDRIGRRISEWAEFSEKFKQIEAACLAKRGAAPRGAGGEVEDPYVKLFDAALKDSSIKTLLQTIDDRLKKCANNLMVSANRRRRESGSSFDQGRYSQAIDILLQADPDKRKELDFHRAANKKSEAETLFAQGAKVRAVKAWIEAAELFLKAAERLRAKREMSYHLAAKCYYRAMTEAKKPALHAPELAKDAPEYARQALIAFREFKRVADADRRGTVDERVIAERKRREEEMLLVTPAINLSLGEYDKVVADADAYLAREEKKPENVPAITWTRFKALREIAQKAIGTGDEAARLEGLGKAAEAMSAGAAEKYYEYACSSMAMVYNDAVGKLEAVAKETGDAEVASRVKRYRLRSAQWNKKVMELSGGTGELGPMAATAKIFFDQKAYEGARGIYVKILSTHDPDGDGIRDELTEALFAQASKNVVVDVDLKDYLIKKLREDIAKLKLLVLGEPEDERTDEGTKEVKPPRKRNWRLAAKAIDKLFEFHPVIKGMEKLSGDLRKIRDELKFRLQILAVRLNLSDSSRALGKRAQETKPEEAEKYWREAVDLIRKVREYHWRDNELRVLQADCHRALGELQEARDLYYEAVETAREYTPQWYAASRAFSDIAFEMGEYRKAMYFADVVLQTVPEEEWKELFPDVKEYREKCEKAIVEAGKEVVLQKITDDRKFSYDTPSDSDLELLRQLKGINERIKLKKLKEEDRKKEQIRAVERHFKNLAREAYARPETLASGKTPQIKKSEIDPTRKMFLAPILYQSPIQQQKLRKFVVNLGVLEDMSDGMSTDLLREDIKKKAIELELLTKDGKKRPKSEIPKELLKKEDVYGVVPVLMKEAAEEAPEAPEAPQAEEAPPAAEEAVEVEEVDEAAEPGEAEEVAP